MLDTDWVWLRDDSGEVGVASAVDSEALLLVFVAVVCLLVDCVSDDDFLVADKIEVTGAAVDILVVSVDMAVIVVCVLPSV